MSTVSSQTFVTAVKSIMVDNAMATFMRHARPGPDVDLREVKDELSRRVEERTEELEALLNTYPADDRDEAQVLLDAARDIEESIAQAMKVLRDPETIATIAPQAARTAEDKLEGEMAAVRRLRSIAHDKAGVEVKVA